MTRRPFGTLPDGSEIELYSIGNGTIELDTINYGAIITSLRVPDRNGRRRDVVLGHDSLTPYLDNRAYLGAVVGRFANRIAFGRFSLDGVAYELAANDGAHHLHGGTAGFDRRSWTAALSRTSDGPAVTFQRTSPAGEENYPGTLRVEVSYLVTSSNSVVIRYEATTDSPTVLNLTQHTYFNLSGEADTNVLDHELRIGAERYLPVGASLIPTGEIADVAGTPFDFRAPARISPRLSIEHEQLQYGRGFDHTFVLPAAAGKMVAAAELRDPISGRRLEIATTEPGLQFYGGQLLDGRSTAADGRRLERYAGLCLETHHFPDAPNQTHFPSVILRPGERYTSTTTWRFAAA